MDIFVNAVGHTDADTRTIDPMDISVIAMGYTDADIPTIFEPAAALLGAATTPLGHSALVCSPINVADLGAADKHISSDANDPTHTYKNVTTVLYVAQVAGHYYRREQGGQTHIQNVLASFRAVRAWCRVRGLHMVVLLRDVMEFKAELAEYPLEDSFPGYSWIDDTTNAQDLGAPMGIDALVRWMMAEEGGVLDDAAKKQPAVYFHFIEDLRATREEADVVFNAMYDIHNEI